MSTTKALVLGGKTGLLGQDIVAHLKQENYEVHTLGREDGNLFNEKFLQKKIKENDYNVIFNTIAHTQVDKAEEEKDIAYKLNRDFPLLVAKIISGSNTALVQYSTDFVFDGKKHTPYTEEDSTNPLSVYGASKYAAEQELQEIDLKQLLILRTAWLFGPYKRNFVSSIIDKSQIGDPLNIVHDQIGSPTFTSDLATNSILLLKKQASGIFHLTNNGRASWFEFAEEAIKIAGITTPVNPITSADYPQLAKRPCYSVLSNEKFIEATGITPRTWTHALRDYLYINLLKDDTL